MRSPRQSLTRATGRQAVWLLGALLLSVVTPEVSAGDPIFGPAQFLPGDMASGLADGHQEEMEIAAGAGVSLAVWSDCRSSLDDATNPEGSGYDIYGVLLDGAGSPIGASFMIDEGPGDQSLPHVAWNGSHWLVAWMEPTPSGPPTYERIRGVRVAPDGTIVDPTPFTIHQESSGCYCSFFGLAMAGGGADGWVVLFQANAEGLRAVRVAADGSVVNPNGKLIDNTISGLAYDIVFAQDEYMIVYGNGTQSYARRYSPTLQFISQVTLPFAREVATDGSNYLVTGQWDYSWPPKIEATLLDHDLTVLVPRFTVKQGTSQWSPSGEGAGFDGTNYWVTWGGNQAHRVSAAGVLLDVESLTLPFASQGVSWPAYDTVPGGGLQFVWHDGLGGAGYARDVYTAQVSPQGQVMSQGALSVGPGAQVEPDFAQGPGVNMLAFRSRASGSARVLVQRLDDSGAALDVEPIEVATGPVEWLDIPSIGAPQVAWNGSVFMVVWSDTIDVFAQRMTADGSFVDAVPITVMTGTHPSVGALGSTFLVTGSLVGQYGAPGAIRAARVDGTSGAVLDVPPTPLGSANSQFPHVVALGDRWLVVWESVTYDPWSASVFINAAAAFVAQDGTKAGSLGTGLGPRPDVAVAGDRALLVAVDDSVSGGATDLDGRIVMADGTFLGPAFKISTAPDEQLEPAATWTGTEFLVAWQDKRNSVIHFDERTDIYGARVSLGGTVLDLDGMPLVAQSQVEIQPTLLTVGSTTLMAVSTLRSDDQSTSVFRLGVHAMAGDPVVCQPDIGFGGPGSSVLSVCGGDLSTGTTADLQLVGAPASTTAFVFASLVNAPTPLEGGVLVPNPWTVVRAFVTDQAGSLLLAGVPGGGGPFSAYVQAVVVDGAQPFGYGFSNAVQVDMLP